MTSTSASLNKGFSLSTTQSAALSGLLKKHLDAAEDDCQRLKALCQERPLAGFDFTAFSQASPRELYLDRQLVLHPHSSLFPEQQEALEKAQLFLNAFRRLYVFIDGGEPGPVVLEPHHRQRLSPLAEPDTSSD